MSIKKTTDQYVVSIVKGDMPFCNLVNKMRDTPEVALCGLRGISAFRQMSNVCICVRFQASPGKPLLGKGMAGYGARVFRHGGSPRKTARGKYCGLWKVAALALIAKSLPEQMPPPLPGS